MSDRDESTGQFASSEPLTGRAAEEHAAGFTPMVDEPNTDADELSKKEAADRLAQLSSSKPIVTYTAGMPDDVTMTVEQGAKLVAEAREADKAQADLDETKALQKEVDELRNPAGVEPAPVETEPDIEKTLNHPRVREALDRHVAEVETTKQQYSKAVETANTFAQAAFIENFPEIAGLPINQWESALVAMQAREPDRFNKAMSTLNRVAQLQAAAQHQQQQKAQAERQQFEVYAKAENARFAELTRNESKETMRAVEAHIPGMLAESGADARQFLEAVSNQSTFPRATAEALLVKAAKYDLLMKNAKAVPSRAPTPHVQRPGAAASRGEKTVANLGTLSSRFNQSGDIKDAVALLTAKRGKR